MKTRLSFLGLSVLVSTFAVVGFSSNAFAERDCSRLFEKDPFRQSAVVREVPPPVHGGILEDAVLQLPHGPVRAKLERLVAARHAQTFGELLERKTTLLATVLKVTLPQTNSKNEVVKEFFPKEVMDAVLEMGRQHQAGQFTQASETFARIMAMDDMFIQSFGSSDAQAVKAGWLEAKSKLDVIRVYATEAKSAPPDLALRVRDLGEVEEAIKMLNRRAYHP